ncbi:MAG: amidase family protein [Actinomycetota bacterium]|nr:amidase family protein [Actinomycetota bacterium]
MIDHPPSITELGQALRDRQTSAVELTEQALEAAARQQDRLHTFILLDHDGALARAKQLDTEAGEGSWRGPLHGIPIAVKDNLYVRGQKTTMGSKIHKDFVPTYTATAVQRLLDAGAVVVGKTNMHEYALGATTDNPHFGTCRNPWDTDRIPGGSSGGSAAAVATGVVPAALGSDTSGSIRVPAAMCGVTGLKPTYGRVSRYGCFPEAWTLDHVGPLALHATDLAIVLDAISGSDSHDEASLPNPPTATATALRGDLGGLVIGVEEDFYFADINPDIASLVRAGIAQLETLGARIEPVQLPSLKDCRYALTITDTSETTTVHHHQLQTRGDDYGPDVRLLLECGALPSAVDYLHAQQVRRLIRRDFADVFTTVDALVAPTLPITTPRIGQDTIDLNGQQVDVIDNLIRLVGPANLAGIPSLSLPCGLTGGVPVGMQLLAPPKSEQVTLNIAVAYEQTNPLKGVRPPTYV